RRVSAHSDRGGRIPRAIILPTVSADLRAHAPQIDDVRTALAQPVPEGEPEEIAPPGSHSDIERALTSTAPRSRCRRRASGATTGSPATRGGLRPAPHKRETATQHGLTARPLDAAPRPQRWRTSDEERRDRPEQAVARAACHRTQPLPPRHSPD